MKTGLMIVSIVLLLGGLLLFLREQNTREELRRAQSENATLSNQVFEARVKITEHTVNAVKLETNLTRRVDELLKTSGRLAAAGEKLGKAEAMLHAAQIQAQELQRQLAAAQSRIAQVEEESEKKQAVFEKQSAEIGRLRFELQESQKDALSSATKVQRAEAELAALHQDFQDTHALRRQLDRIKRFGRTPANTLTNQLTRGAQHLATRPNHARGRLILQADGSVSFQPQAAAR